MNISVYDSITVSEYIFPIIPGLVQYNLDIISGKTYRLTFSSDITSGILKVYQGTQEVYNTSIVQAKSVSDIIYVTERIYLDRRSSMSIYNSIAVTENISLSIFYPISKYDSITVSENIQITII